VKAVRICFRLAGKSCISINCKSTGALAVIHGADGRRICPPPSKHHHLAIVEAHSRQ
jgi:hypothetical protein